MVYRWIGKLVLGYSARYAKRKLTTRTGLVTLGVGAGVVALGAAAYLASRDVPEG